MTQPRTFISLFTILTISLRASAIRHEATAALFTSPLGGDYQMPSSAIPGSMGDLEKSLKSGGVDGLLSALKELRNKEDTQAASSTLVKSGSDGQAMYDLRSLKSHDTAAPAQHVSKVAKVPPPAITPPSPAQPIPRVARAAVAPPPRTAPPMLAQSMLRVARIATVPPPTPPMPAHPVPSASESGPENADAGPPTASSDLMAKLRSAGLTDIDVLSTTKGRPSPSGPLIDVKKLTVWPPTPKDTSTADREPPSTPAAAALQTSADVNTLKQGLAAMQSQISQFFGNYEKSDVERRLEFVEDRNKRLGEHLHLDVDQADELESQARADAGRVRDIEEENDRLRSELQGLRKHTAAFLGSTAHVTRPEPMGNEAAPSNIRTYYHEKRRDVQR